MMLALPAAVAALLSGAAPVDVGAADRAAAVDAALDGDRLLQARDMLRRWRSDLGASTSRAFDVRLGRLAIREGRYAQGIAHLQSIAPGGAPECATTEALGEGYLRTGERQAALATLEPARVACAQRWRSWNLLGIAYGLIGRFDDSRAAFEHAFRLTDRPTTVVNNYAFSLLLAGRSVEAARMFDTIVESTPASHRYRNNGDIAWSMAGRMTPDAPAGGESPDRAAERLRNAAHVHDVAGRSAMATTLRARAADSDLFGSTAPPPSPRPANDDR